MCKKINEKNSREFLTKAESTALPALLLCLHFMAWHTQGLQVVVIIASALGLVDDVVYL